MIGHPCGRVVALLLAIVMGVAVTSCDTSAPDPADDGAVPIGGLFSLTGNWSTLGRTSKAALEFAVEDVNRHLQDTGASLRLEPVVEDTRLEPALALAGAQALRMRASRRGLTLGSIRKGRMIGCADTSIIAPFPEVPSHLGTARSRLRPARNGIPGAGSNRSVRRGLGTSGQPGAVMKTLLFLRHAKAEPGGSDDHERSLTPDGETAARNVGLLLARTEARPDVVVTSTALRARQTLACAREAGHWSAPVQAVRDLYEAKSRRVLEEIQYVPEPSQTVLLIGHEPAWSRTVCRLTGGSDLHFPAGTLARVQTNARVWADVGFGRCELVWLMPPAVVAFLVAGS